MDKVKIILENGISKEVDGIFYLYNQKYYFIYTEKELDENGYVILHLVQVGKEIKNSPTGPFETGYMIGVEIADENEWSIVKESVSKIVEDKKNKTQSPDIQYLPITMLNNLKIISKKHFKLLNNVVESFGLKLDYVNNDVINDYELNTNTNEAELSDTMSLEQAQSQNINNEDVIIDYRARFFEEREKNNQLQNEIDILKQKLENIKNII